jgi:hypothetical protein
MRTLEEALEVILCAQTFEERFLASPAPSRLTDAVAGGRRLDCLRSRPDDFIDLRVEAEALVFHSTFPRRGACCWLGIH